MSIVAQKDYSYRLEHVSTDHDFIPYYEIAGTRLAGITTYSVVIVDDEPRALSGIRVTFPWEKYGFEVALATDDATEALRYLLDNEVDLAFVDIRMPEIDGIELIARTHEQRRSTDFVIVSGHSEFEYAQKALRYGVSDYCLKPIEQDTAEEILRKARARLEAKRSSETGTSPRGIPADGFFEISFEANPEYRIAIHRKKISGADDRLPAFSKGVEIIRQASAGSETIYILDAGSIDPESICTSVPAHTCIAIGSCARNAGELPVSLKRAREALRETTFRENERVYLWERPRQRIIDSLVTEFRDAVESGVSSIVETYLDGLCESLQEKRIRPWELDILASRFATTAEDYYIPAQPNPKKGTQDALPVAGETYREFADSLSKYLSEHTETVVHHINKLARNNPKIRSLVDYVNVHLEERFTLQELANRYGLHPNYASELFKQATGMRFSDYVTHIKIWRSKILLRRTEDTVAEIAEQVGYDYFHYSKLFKRHVGMTPKQYRKASAQ